MARPTKSISTAQGARTKEEIAARTDAEKSMRGGSNKLKAPDYLTDSQKKIFNFIIKNLKEAGILGNLDLYILSMSAVTIDGMIELDTKINQCVDFDEKIDYMRVREKYTKDFFRCCNELSLSPQSRAKISLASAKEAMANKNPLLEALEL